MSTYYIISYYIVLYYIILYCIIWYHIRVYYIISYCIILYYIILYYIILYYIILYQCYIIAYHIISYHYEDVIIINLLLSWLNWHLILIIVFLCTCIPVITTVNVMPTSQLPVLRGFARGCSQAIESALRENTHRALSEPIGISRSVSVIAPGTFRFSFCSTITAWRNTYFWTWC